MISVTLSEPRSSACNLKWPRMKPFLYVSTSTIPGAGLGLFAEDRFTKGGEVVGFVDQACLTHRKTYDTRKKADDWDPSPMKITHDPDNGKAEYDPPAHDFFIEQQHGNHLYFDRTATNSRFTDSSIDVRDRAPLWYRLNHSSDPNLELTRNSVGLVVWVAMRNIGRYEELFFEYDEGFVF